MFRREYDMNVEYVSSSVLENLKESDLNVTVGNLSIIPSIAERMVSQYGKDEAVEKTENEFLEFYV